MRHIETVRNIIGFVIRRLTMLSEKHDQTKLESPEVEIFEEYTPKLRGVTYGSDEYKRYMKEMKVAIDHHNAANAHHPEHFKNGIRGMDLLVLIEMICDWKAASLRHDDGDILKSIKINQKRFGYSDELAEIFYNTAILLNVAIINDEIIHKADES